MAVTYCVITAAASANPGSSDVITTDFGTSIHTACGGLFRCIGGNPGQIADELTELGAPPADCWRITVQSDAPTEQVGALIPLFDAQSGRTATDADCQCQPGSELLLRILGSIGRRVLHIEFVPSRNHHARGIPMAMLASDKLSSDRWQDVHVALPSSNDGGSDSGFIRIIAEGSGPAWFALDRLVLTSPSADTQQARDNNHQAVDDSSHPLRTALWVWRTREIMPDPSRRADLLAFCKRHGITDLFVQVPYEYDGQTVTVQLADKLRAFNQAAHAQNVTMHALDGRPEYVLRKNHPQMLALIDALAAFNRASESPQRFNAVHLDNEPYVLSDWRDMSQRRQIISDYVALQQRLHRKASGYDLEYGIDIPFWFDSTNRNGQPRFVAETESGSVPLLEALFAHVDNVGIMSYRERALGPDGVVAHCLNEFELGQRTGVGVFASVELGTGANVEPRTTFGPYPLSYFDSQLHTLRRVLARTPGCIGIAVHYFSEYQQLENQS